MLGVQNMSTADGGLALQWADNGTADHNWEIIVDGTAVRLRNVNSGKVLGVENMSTADNARVLQWADNGTADHRWTLVDEGDGTHKIRNVNSGKLLAIQNGSTANGAQAVQDSDNGTPDNQWRFVPNGARRIQNLASGLVLGVTEHVHRRRRPGHPVGRHRHRRPPVDRRSSTPAATCGCATPTAARCSASRTPAPPTARGSSSGPTTAPPTTGGGCGTAANGYFRIQCANGGRVLGVSGASTAQGAQIVLWDDNGTNDHLWRFV